MAEASVPSSRPWSQETSPRPVQQHTHQWIQKTRKVWVDPVIRKVKVGTDKDGNPIYRNKVIRPGYWKTIVYYQCACGARKESG